MGRRLVLFVLPIEVRIKYGSRFVRIRQALAMRLRSWGGRRDWLLIRNALRPKDLRDFRRRTHLHDFIDLELLSELLFQFHH